MKNIQPIIVGVISYFFILVFIYASASKMLDFENFQVQLAQSPLLSAYAGFISYGVIILEVMIAGVLADPKVRRIGLYASFGLMVAFTVYIFLILKYSDFIPCSCGGILEKMSWDEHLIFNIGCVGLALSAIVFIQKERAHGWRRTALTVALTAVLASGSIVALFLSSEHIVKKENNFTRRFPHHPIMEEQAYDLKVNSYYFAGTSGNDLYLGNSSTPFHLLKINFSLQKIDTLDMIQYPGNGPRFQDLRYTVQGETLYAYDGTVPIIYGVNVNLFGATMMQLSREELFFDQLVAFDPFKFMLRVKEKATGKTALATLSLLAAKKVNINSTLLTKTADGGFDADGQLLYDYDLGSAYYLFYYRNQILKLNSSLRMVSQMKTIDTVATARLKVVTMKDGRKKLAQAPLLVNRSMTVHRGLIFNESGLRGRHESRDTWKENAVVDIYTTEPAGYWGSMYVQHRGKNRMSQMLVTDKYFFVLSGNEIVRYSFAQTLTENFISGRSRKPVSE